MKFIIGFILCVGLIFGTLAIGDNIPAPPPLKDLPAELQHYLRSIYENLHRLPVATVNPDGVRRGKKGDIVLLEVDDAAGDRFYLEVNVDSDKSWSGIQITNLP